MGDRDRGRNFPATVPGPGGETSSTTEWFMPFIPDEAGAGPVGGAPVLPPASAAEGRRVSGFVRFVGTCLMIFALVVALAAAVGGGFGSLVTESDTVTRSYPVGASPTIAINNAHGSVEVAAGSGDQVTVRVTRLARGLSHSSARRDLEGIPVTIQPTASGVQIDTQEGHGWSPFAQREVRIAVTVPASSTLAVSQAAGTLRIRDISGKVTATVSAGSMVLDNVTLGNGSRIEVNAGNAQVTGALATGASADISVNAGNANLYLPAKTDAWLDATAEAGNIGVTNWPQPISVSRQGPNATAYGKLSPSPQGTLKVEVHAGNIVLVPR